MGFMDAMKGANMNFGTVDSPDFMASYLTTKGDHFMITSAQAGTYEFTKADVAEFKMVIAGDEFIKWKMVFKDGKIAIITSGINDPTVQSGSSMAPIERFFGDLLDVDDEDDSISEEISDDLPPRESELVVEETPIVEESLAAEESPVVEENKSTPLTEEKPKPVDVEKEVTVDDKPKKKSKKFLIFIFIALGVLLFLLPIILIVFALGAFR